MNTKLHAVTDAEGRPIRFYITAGQVSDYTGAAALLGSLPSAEWLLADRGYDADWFRDALKDRGIKPCIPGRKSRGKPIEFHSNNLLGQSAKAYLDSLALGVSILHTAVRPMANGP